MAAISTALVVGGGIAGLTAAIALRQQGVAVDLVEIAPSLGVYGVGIIQPNNTLRALDRIGLAQACIRDGAAFPGWRIFDRAANLLLEAPAPATAAPHLAPVNGITRPRLHQILDQAAREAAVSIAFDVSVAEISQGADAAAVVFTDGREATYDLVVGCDGIRSRLRAMVFGEVCEPAFAGQGVWRYNLPRPADMAWGGIYFGARSKLGLVPLASSSMYMFLVTAEAGDGRREGPSLAGDLRERLAEYGGPIPALAEHVTDPGAVVYRPMHNLLMPAPWHKDRVVIIGDAAHATTPHLAQGAAMAIEDAVLLAELMGKDADVAEQLQEFMRRRYERAKFVVDASSQLAAWELQEWAGQHLPDVNPGAFLHESTVKLMEEY